jgi:CubicO group peptidase (beta-lactamase class C family)
VSALGAVASWPVGAAAVGVVTAGGDRQVVGDAGRPFPWASVTKVATALTCWVAVEEGTLDLDAAAGPPGATVRHLLAHASGLAPDGDGTLAPPGQRRIYSNRGFEVLADALEAAAGMSFGAYLDEAVLAPLGMSATRLDGSPAHGAVGPLEDLLRLGGELLSPTVVDPSTVAAATEVAFAGLDGVLPGFGQQSPNDWGLGVEVRDGKSPHWTPRTASPGTFGHFGRSGSFLWVDPAAAVACCCLSDREFGPWAAVAWPALGEAVLAEQAPPT